MWPISQIYIRITHDGIWIAYAIPIGWGSKRQGRVSHSTPEAEIIAADYALRTHAIPVISLWKTLVGSDPEIIFHDDNQGMIAIIRSGQNPTMHHLERTHGISIQWMHEIFQNDLTYLGLWGNIKDVCWHSYQSVQGSHDLEAGMYAYQHTLLRWYFIRWPMVYHAAYSRYIHRIRTTL